uniref:Uncharacterized protein n=1 Tax=Rhizophora mucronata TaxID=61149 RepID=A0A2P2ISH6_RHIMU
MLTKVKIKHLSEMTKLALVGGS